MPDQPFHHGNLRAVLLDQAQAVLRKRGIDALSLRELAREAGVSHGAPRNHFIDRGALLDALAERGFIRLADEIREAASHSPDDYARALHAAGSAYVSFAVKDSALLDLMFAAKADDPSEPVRSAAERLYGTMTDIMSAGVEAGGYDARDVGRLTLVLAATVQGISALVASRRITTAESEALIDDAITLFLAGASTKH
jgi:AcrR family transcriptional regulator